MSTEHDQQRKKKQSGNTRSACRQAKLGIRAAKMGGPGVVKSTIGSFASGHTFLFFLEFRLFASSVRVSVSILHSLLQHSLRTDRKTDGTRGKKEFRQDADAQTGAEQRWTWIGTLGRGWTGTRAPREGRGVCGLSLASPRLASLAGGTWSDWRELSIYPFVYLRCCIIHGVPSKFTACFDFEMTFLDAVCNVTWCSGQFVIGMVANEKGRRMSVASTSPNQHTTQTIRRVLRPSHSQ